MTATTIASTPVRQSQLRPAIAELQPHLVEWRRHLHAQPELAFQEYLTAEFISQKLKEWGIEHQTGIAKTGIVAIIDSGVPGPVLGIRADMEERPNRILDAKILDAVKKKF